LNGEIIDPYRNFRNFNGLHVDRFQPCRDNRYFDKYSGILKECLNKTDRALFATKRFKIFNPFYYNTYSSGGYYGNDNIRYWDKTDFIKFDIRELFNDYNYMVLLPCWWRCEEARLKKSVAKCLGIKIITFKKMIRELS
jgi:hypothetical protein